MNHCVNLFLLKKILNRLLVTAIDLIERDILPSGNLLNSIEASHIAV